MNSVGSCGIHFSSMAQSISIHLNDFSFIQQSFI
jgi:hypothetical protein